MKRNTKITNSTPLESSRDLAMMLRQLPKDERLRIEGIIIGVGMRCGEAPSSIQPST